MPKLSENTEVALPLRNIISMVAAASLATWAYFGLIERLNTLETNQTMMQADLEQNTEFRINGLEERWGACQRILSSLC